MARGFWYHSTWLGMPSRRRDLSCMMMLRGPRRTGKKQGCGNEVDVKPCSRSAAMTAAAAWKWSDTPV